LVPSASAILFLLQETKVIPGKRWRPAIFVLALLLLLIAPPVQAHKPSDSYLTLTVRGGSTDVQWDIALRDLDFAISLDTDGNGDITWGEVKERFAAIDAYALPRLVILADGQVCPFGVVDYLIENHNDGAYVVLRFAAACPYAPARLGVTYRLFAEIDPQHKGLLNLTDSGVTRTAIFDPHAADQTFFLGGVDNWRQVLDFVKTGVEHIWSGFDHILFLLSLLLPAVLICKDSRWEGRQVFKGAFLEVAKIVTAFTLAHSITLSLATFQIVTIPARISESAIALSVVVAAANNIAPLLQGKLWTVAFGFGLIHGFGFANVLTDLGLPAGARALALVGFNLGVELGQLVIVAAFLPVAWVFRRTLLYRRIVLYGGSAAIIVVAALWFVERSFDVNFSTPT
jgi:hypothetical protein